MPSIGAAAAVLEYAQNAWCQSLSFIKSLRDAANEKYLHIDANSCRNLEISERISTGPDSATLFATVNRTATPMGARLLKQWLHAPLTDQVAVMRRHEFVATILAGSSRQRLWNDLRSIGDMERIVSRIALGSASPRDLSKLKEGLGAFGNVQEHVATLDRSAVAASVLETSSQPDVQSLIGRAIVDEPPATIRDGGFIAAGYNAELDELRQISTGERSFLNDLERRERTRTDVPNLSVGYNRIHGYYIEVSRSTQFKIPIDYIRRQTLKNVERYVTPELKEFEQRVLSSQSESLALEKRLYEELIDNLQSQVDALRDVAQTLARVDALRSFAEIAVEHNYVRPEFTTEPQIHIEEGRHPVLAAMPTQTFVPNSVSLRDDRTDAAHHRSEHGRQVDLHAPNRAHRPARLRRQATYRRPARYSAPSIAYSPESVHPTIWPAVNRRSWSK